MKDAALRGFYLGASEVVGRQLGEILGAPCRLEWPRDVKRGDLVFIDAAPDASARGELPGGNAFTACRHLKERAGVHVFILVEPGDSITPEIARFCLADGTLEVGPDGLVGGEDAVRERLRPHRPRVSIDALLAKLEKSIASDEGRQASALQRMLTEGENTGLLNKLVDSETGLFDGPYASFKLDEEFKRSARFHQPLSLLLLDIGVDLKGLADPEQRQDLLAEVASVFLNECRDIDVIGRFTQSTFMTLMPGTGSAGAEQMARRMLDGIRQRGVFSAVSGSPCCGMATVPAAGIQNRRAFLARAEACLQLAREGKGQGGFCASSE